MTAMGHQERLSPPRLSGCCRFGQGTFAEAPDDGRDAPTAVIGTMPIEPSASTLRPFVG
jgi:hypothetical protein